MIRFSEIPAIDRWRVFDTEFPKIIEAYTGAATVDPAEEMSVEELATRHGLSVKKMVEKLTELGANPYRLGKVWHVRRKSYVVALEAAEKGSTAHAA